MLRGWLFVNLVSGADALLTSGSPAQQRVFGSTSSWGVEPGSQQLTTPRRFTGIDGKEEPQEPYTRPRGSLERASVDIALSSRKGSLSAREKPGSSVTRLPGIQHYYKERLTREAR